MSIYHILEHTTTIYYLFPRRNKHHCGHRSIGGSSRDHGGAHGLARWAAAGAAATGQGRPGIHGGFHGILLGFDQQSHWVIFFMGHGLKVIQFMISVSKSLCSVFL